MKQSSAIDRRTFLKLGSAGVAGALSINRLAAAAEEGTAPIGGVTPVYRTLGRTGMKVTVVSIGAMRTSESAVLRAAFDRGVNYVDTARGYMGPGVNEAIVGEAVKGIRDKLYVATKFSPLGTKEEIIQSCEDSLVSLGLDYVDLLQAHCPPPEYIQQDHVREALTQLQQDGKIRFKGITTHKDEVACVNAVVDDPEKLFDTALVVYNFESGPEIREAIARAAEAGIGIIAMKTQAGGYEKEALGGVTPHQAALKWVLADEHVTCAVPAMVDLAQVEEDTAVMNLMAMTAAEAQVLRRYAEAIEGDWCHRCGVCERACPKGVDIRDVNRCVMYAEGYRDLRLARENYARIAPERSLAACGDCAACTLRCVHGIDLPNRVARARTLFA